MGRSEFSANPCNNPKEKHIIQFIYSIRQTLLTFNMILITRQQQKTKLYIGKRYITKDGMGVNGIPHTMLCPTHIYKRQLAPYVSYLTPFSSSPDLVKPPIP